MTSFGEVLRAARITKGMSQGGLGNALGMSLSTVSQWEDERFLPEPDTVFRLEHCLGVPPGHLSRHLGYVPAEADPGVDLATHIRDSAEITEDGRDLLLYTLERVRVPASRRHGRGRSPRP